MTKKNGRVEFLRFIFALGILFFHIHKRFADGGMIELGNTGLNFFARGYIGVEFFFLVSGYLLAASAYAKREKSTAMIGTETALMMKKKFSLSSLCNRTYDYRKCVFPGEDSSGQISLCSGFLGIYILLAGIWIRQYMGK